MILSVIFQAARPVKSIIAAMVFVAGDIVSAQAEVVSGYVRDADEAPVAYATVGLKGERQGTVTDVSGFFTLDVGERERLVLVVRCVGYEESEHEVEDMRDTVYIRLLRGESFLNTVVITGTRTERRLKDVPVLTKVVSETDLRDAGAVTVSDALESLMPGVHFDPNR